MKYLILLGMLLFTGCTNKPLYKIGECFRLYTTVNVSNYIVLDIFKNKYVVSPIKAEKDGNYYYPNYNLVFTEFEIEGRSKLINCKTLK